MAGSSDAPAVNIDLDTEAEADWIKTVTLDRHGALDTLEALRAGRRDPEVRAALEAFHARHLPGKHDQKKHGGGGGTISPGVQEPNKTRVENPVDGPDGSDWGAVTANEADRKWIQAKNDAAGLPSVDEMERNLDGFVDVLDPGALDKGREWYQGAQGRTQEMARERAGDQRQLTHEQATAMTSAMSPQCRWETNLVWADHVTDMVRRDPVIDDAFLDQISDVGGDRVRLRDDDKLRGLTPGRRFSEYSRDEQVWLAIRSGQKPMTAVSVAGKDKGLTFNANAMMGGSVKTALNIAFDPKATDAAGVTQYLGGHKTRSFYDNILTGGGPPGVVTIDVHASDAAWLGLAAHAPRPGFPEYKGAGASEKMKATLGAGARVRLGVKGTGYAPTAEAYRRVVAKYNQKHGTSYTVADMQAAVWLLTLE